MTDREADGEALSRQIERLREQRAAVHDVLRQVARSEGLQPVLDEIVRAAQRLCRGEHAVLNLAHGDLFHIQAQSDMSAVWEYSRNPSAQA